MQDKRSQSPWLGRKLDVWGTRRIRKTMSASTLCGPGQVCKNRVSALSPFSSIIWQAQPALSWQPSGD